MDKKLQKLEDLTLKYIDDFSNSGVYSVVSYLECILDELQSAKEELNIYLENQEE